MFAAAALTLSRPALASPDVELTTQPTFELTPRQHRPAASFDGVDWLVVWHDQRGVGDEIWGQRVAADGQLRDPYGIRVTGRTDGASHIGIAWNGTRHLIVWSRLDTDTMQRLDLQGVLVDAHGIAQSELLRFGHVDRNENDPIVASDGKDFVVAWWGNTVGVNDSMVGVVRVLGDGTIPDPDGTILTTTGDPWLPRVAWDGTSYLVAWNQNGAGWWDDIRGRRLGRDGAPLGSELVLEAKANKTSNIGSLLCTAADCVLTWSEFDWKARFFAPAATTFDATPVAIDSTPEINRSLACAGGTCLQSWGAGSGDYAGARRFTKDGALDTTPLALCNGTRACFDGSVTAGDGQFYYVGGDATRDSTSGTVYPNTLVRGRRVGADGSTPDALVALTPPKVAPSQEMPRVAHFGDTWIVVWEERGSKDQVEGNYDASVRCARMKDDGTVLDPSGITLAESGAQPSVAAGPDGFAVVWTRRKVFDTPITRYVQGLVVPFSGLPAGAPQTVSIAGTGGPGTGEDPAIAWSGDHFLLTWTASLGAAGAEVRAIRFTSALSPVESAAFPIVTAADSVSESRPALASSADGWFVSWVDGRRGVSIYGARVGLDGAVLDASGVPISAANPGERRIFEPFVTAAPGGWLVGWRQFLGNDGEILVRTVGVDGVPRDAEHSPGPVGSVPRAVDAAYDDGSVVVAWEQDSERDVVTMRIARLGPNNEAATTTDDTPDLDLVAEPALGSAATGLFLAYARFDPDPAVDALRIFVRAAVSDPSDPDPGPEPAVEVAPESSDVEDAASDAETTASADGGDVGAPESDASEVDPEPGPEPSAEPMPDDTTVVAPDPGPEPSAEPIADETDVVAPEPDPQPRGDGSDGCHGGPATTGLALLALLRIARRPRARPASGAL